MTPEAIGLIKASHAQATATPRQLADRFYEHLFAAEPSLRRLFPHDLTLLEGHFEAALALVVRNLDEMSVSFLLRCSKKRKPPLASSDS